MAGRRPLEDPAAFDARVLRQLQAAPGLTAYQLARLLGLIDQFGRPKGPLVRKALGRLEAAHRVEQARIDHRVVWRPLITCPMCHGESETCTLCGGAGIT